MNNQKFPSQFGNFEQQVSRLTDSKDMQSRLKKKSKSSNVEKVEKIMVYVLAALAFFLPWVFTQKTYEYYEITKNTLLILGVIILLALWAVKVGLQKRLTLVRTPFDVPILIILVSSVISTIFSIYVQTSMWGFFSRLTGGLISTVILIALYYIIVNNITKKKYIKLVFKVLLVSISILALFIILKSFNAFESLFINLGESHPSLTFLNSPLFSPVGNPNAVAFVFLLSLPLVFVGISRSEDNIKEQFFSVISACLLLFAIGITTATPSFRIINLATWIIVLGSIITILLYKMPVNTNILVKFLPIVIVAIYSLFFSVNNQIRELVIKDFNFARYQEVPFDTSWSVISGTFKEHKVKGFLFGTGLDTYAYNFPRFRPAEQNLEPNWHQNYTRSSTQIESILTNMGILGLIGFCIFMFFIASFFLKVVLKRDVSTEGKLLFGMGAGVIIILVSIFLTYFSITIFFILWLLLGLLVSLYFSLHERSKERIDLSLSISKSKVAMEQNQGLLSYVFTVVFVSFLIVFSYFVGKNYIAEVQYKKSLVGSAFNDFPVANDNAVKAIRKFDKRDHYHRQLASVALQALKQSLAKTQDEEDTSQQAYQSYLINLIREEVNTALRLNRLDPSNWETASVIFKELVDLSGGQLYGNETLYASSQAIALNPFNPDNYIVLGYIYQFNSNDELQQQAERIFVQAYSLKPGYPLTIFALGNYLEYVEKYDEAIQLYQTSLNSYFTGESQIRELILERLDQIEEKRKGNKIEGEQDTQVPSNDEITEEVEDNVLPSTENSDTN